MGNRDQHGLLHTLGGVMRLIRIALLGFVLMAGTGGLVASHMGASHSGAVTADVGWNPGG